MNIGIRIKIPPAPKPQINRATHRVITSCANAIIAQLTIIGAALSRRLALRPILSARYPKASVPKIAPKLTVEPIHDASVEVIGPVENRGFVSEVKSRKAGEVQPQEPPNDMHRRFTGRGGTH